MKELVRCHKKLICHFTPTKKNKCAIDLFTFFIEGFNFFVFECKTKIL
jgi:hypothetical protein